MTTIDEVYIRLNKMRDTLNEAELGDDISTTAENFGKLKRELIGQLYDTVKIVRKAMNRRIEKTDPEYIELLESQVAAQKVLLEEARKGAVFRI